MKKINLCLVFIFAFVFFATNIAFAGSIVSEKPEIKIVIDGTQGKYSMPPLLVNNRTMLPLTEILDKLGVDKGNIKWNKKNKSITITKDSTKVVLLVDNSKAFVNDKPIILDVPPVIYKNKTYIPVSFVSNSLEKKVVWDGSTSTIVICDKNSFDQVKDILNKSTSATIRFKGIGNVTIESEKRKVKVQRITEEDDIKKRNHTIQKTDANGVEAQSEFYISDNTKYEMSSEVPFWTKKSLSEKELNDELSSNSFNDAFIAGLKIKNEKNEIILQGDIGLATITDNVKNDATYKIKTSIIIDKNSYLIKEMRFNGSGIDVIDEEKEPYVFTSDFTFNILDEGYEIKVPEEVINKAEKGLLTLKTDDSKAEIDVPSSWIVFDKADAPQSTLFAGNEKEDVFVSIPSDNKNDLSDDVDINYYAELIEKQMADNESNSNMGEMRNLKINGKNALQYEFSGEYEKTKIKHLITIIESDSNFYQVNSWTTQSKFESYKDTFKDIANSFREIIK